MAGAQPSFCSTKQLRVLLLPLDEMLVHRRVTHQQYVAGTHLYTWVKRDNVGQSFLSKETTRWQGLSLEHYTSGNNVEQNLFINVSHLAPFWLGNRNNTEQCRPGIELLTFTLLGLRGLWLPFFLGFEDIFIYNICQMAFCKLGFCGFYQSRQNNTFICFVNIYFPLWKTAQFSVEAIHSVNLFVIISLYQKQKA